jgi:hypothetical protein
MKGEKIMEYQLNYVHHSNVRQGGHGVYSDAKNRKVAITATTDEEATEEAKKEWASITSQKEAQAAVVFGSLVKVVDWTPENKEVHLS